LADSFDVVEQRMARNARAGLSEIERQGPVSPRFLLRPSRGEQSSQHEAPQD